MDEGSAVNTDTGSAPVESNPSPAPSAETSSSQSSSAPARSEPAPRSYSQAEVESTIRARLDQANRAAEKRFAALQERIQKYEAGMRAWGEQTGVIPPQKPPEPQYVPADRLQQALHSQKQEILQELEVKQLTAKVESDWTSVEKAHPEHATLPGFKEAFLKAWGANPAGGSELAKDIVKAYDDYFAKRQQQYAQSKAEAARTTVVPPGQGAGAASPKDKPRLADRIAATLAGR